MEYKPTSLEKLHKTELHTDHDLGVVIDLINPDTYMVRHGSNSWNFLSCASLHATVSLLLEKGWGDFQVIR